MNLHVHSTAQETAPAPLRSLKSLLPALLSPGVPGSGVGVLVSFEVTEAGVATCKRGQASTRHCSAVGVLVYFEVTKAGVAICRRGQASTRHFAAADCPQRSPQSRAVGRCTDSTPLCWGLFGGYPLAYPISYKLMFANRLGRC